MGCLAAALFLLSAVAKVNAVEVTAVGYLDQGALEAMPQFRAAAEQLQKYKDSLQPEFAGAMRDATSAAEQRAISDRFAAQFAARQAAVLTPLYDRGRMAIAEVAGRRHLSIVLDRRMVLIGGLDITHDVMKRLANPAPIAKPHALPAATIGYVDEQQLNSVPKIKAMNDQFAAAQQDIDQQAQSDMKTAKTDAARQAIAKRAQDQHAEKEKQLVDPVVSELDSAMGKVARADGVALIVDKAAVLAGGRDVTPDVVEAIK